MFEGIAIFVLSIVFFMGLLAGPILLYKKITHKPKKQNRPYREPSIFPNSFGHLVMVEPEPTMQKLVEDYFKNNPEKKKDWENGLNK